MKLFGLLLFAMLYASQIDALGCACSVICNPHKDTKWFAFKRVHRKTYVDLEDEMERYQIYLRNLYKVRLKHRFLYFLRISVNFFCNTFQFGSSSSLHNPLRVLSSTKPPSSKFFEKFSKQIKNHI